MKSLMVHVVDTRTGIVAMRRSLQEERANVSTNTFIPCACTASFT